MIDWDDIRHFLAVAREGSLRAGADSLGVRHSTVLRHVGQLEERLGARLFDRLPSGYRLTDAGQEVLELAEQMATASNRLESRVLGRDEGARGHLRVTMTEMLATHLLMPDLADFIREHPEIELDIVSSDAPANLTNREADVAIRVLGDAASLPLNLHGLKGPELHGAVFMAGSALERWRKAPRPVRWIFKEFDRLPDWARRGEVAIDAVHVRVADAGTHIAAVRQGLGMSALPCFVGDADASLARVPGTASRRYGTIWLLTQGEARRSRRVRLFVDFVAQRIAAHADLLAGNSPRRS